MTNKKEETPSLDQMPHALSFGTAAAAFSLERKMQDMRERFRALQLIEDGDGKDDNIESPAHQPGESKRESPHPSNLAALRWDKLRKVVRTGTATGSSFAAPSRSEYDSPRSPRADFDDEVATKKDEKDEKDDSPLISRPGSSGKPSRPTSGKGVRVTSGKPSNKSIKKLDLEDMELGELWKKESFFQPYPFEKASKPDLSLPPIPVSDIEIKFEEEIDPVKLEISRMPEEAVNEKKEILEKGLFAQHTANIQTLKNLQTDVIWREDLARKRVTELEEKTKQRMKIEKTKMITAAIDREKNLGQQFRKAREELEEGIRRQEGAVREHFGKVLVHNESLARRFFVFTKMFPQPIEVRIHLMRAVKDKLPKGAYVVMLTQYDRLGGNPLIWSEIGSNGIGKMRPGITKIARHQGRYYDRVLRFEDSCFTLCPPRPRIRPGYIFVLELFQLASHKNPYDKIVAWTAVPMSYESMNIIEGKFKLPMLRGEHTQKIQHFREMEQSIASDLNSWLCNVYIEVRHMSLHELGATEEMLKSADFDLDYFNKVALSDSYLKNNANAYNATKAAAGDGNKNEKVFGSESHKSVIAKSPFAPFDILLSPSAISDKPLYEKAASNENSKTEELDELDRLEKQIKKELDIEEKKEEKKKEKDEEGEGKKGDEKPSEDLSFLQLPVDKGIFRRKIHLSIETAKDVETGPPITGRDSSVNNGSLVAQGHDQSASFSEEESKKDRKSLASKGFFDSWLILFGLKKANRTNSFKPTNDDSSSAAVALLSANDSFNDHKRLMIQKWKENVRKKFPRNQQGGALMDLGYQKDELVDIRERGYHLQDETFLHKHQRGKLTGLETIDKKENRQWAQATLEGKIARKWQSDGPRFDSEAIRTPMEGHISPRDRTSPQNDGYYSPTSGRKHFFAPNTKVALGGGGGRGGGGMGDDNDEDNLDKNWEELRDTREMQDYQMSISADPTNRKNLIPGAIAASKLRYLTQELFGDLVPTFFGTFEFYMTILLYLYTFWMRIYVHYLAQYLFILYSSSAISEAVEVGIVAIGPIANICVFLFMALFGSLFYKFSGFLPDSFSKLFAYYGVATILDPLLTLLVDLIYHHYTCDQIDSICASDYTSNQCNCYNGDFIKLWDRVESSEGTGLTGLFITLMIYLGTGVLSSLILHEYLLHVHRDGRILDLWRRVNAPAEEFFLPDDYEIGSEELIKIIHAAKVFKGLLPGIVIKRNVVIHEGIEKDPNDTNFLGNYKRIIIYQNESNGKQFVYRHFLMDNYGKIVEIFNDAIGKPSDLLPKRAFQGLLNNNNKDGNKDGTNAAAAAAPTGGTIAIAAEDLAGKGIEEKEGKEDEKAETKDDSSVKNPLVPSLKLSPSSGSVPGSVPPSARSGRGLPAPTNPLPKGLLTPNQLNSALTSPRFPNSKTGSPRALAGEPDDADEDLNYELLPQEADYQYQEDLIRQKRKQLKLADEVELDDEYYNQDRHEDDQDDHHYEDDHDGIGFDGNDEALLSNQPMQAKKHTPPKKTRKIVKQPPK